MAAVLCERERERECERVVIAPFKNLNVGPQLFGGQDGGAHNYGPANVCGMLLTLLAVLIVIKLGREPAGPPGRN